MIGWTLSRYFAIRYLITVAWFLAAISALIFIADFTQLNDRFGGLDNFSLGLGLKIAALRFLMIIQQALPFIGLFASMAVLIQLNRKYELVVARSAGLSAWQFLTPLCAGAFLFGLAAITFINPLAARGFALGEDYQSSLTSKTTGSSGALQVPWIRQFSPNGDVIIGAKAVLNRGTVLVSPVFIVLDSNGLIVKRIDALNAKLGNKEWLITSAIQSQQGAVSNALPEVKIATNLTPELVQEQLLLPEMIPVFDLPQKIAVAKSLGYPASGFAMQFHSVIALPALLVVMTLIAATVTLKFVRFGQSAGMILGGILAGFMLYVVSVLVKAFGGAGIVPPVVAAWIPVLLAFLFGVSFLLHKEDG
jgi:lipopolysaccharide export system permease protein